MAAAVGGGVAATAPGAATVVAHDAATDQTTVAFSTPGNQTWTVPDGVDQITVDAYGAQGWSLSASVPGGMGAHAQGTIDVTPGESMAVGVGSDHSPNDDSSKPSTGFEIGSLEAVGGYASDLSSPVGRGGGGSGIGTGSQPLIVAAGGGGAGTASEVSDNSNPSETDVEGASGAGGASAGAGMDGDAVSDSVQGCSGGGGGGGAGATASAPGAGDDSGLTDCTSYNATDNDVQTAGYAFTGDTGLAGDVAAQGAGGSGQNLAQPAGSENPGGDCGGGGGGGWHGGEGGGIQTGSYERSSGTTVANSSYEHSYNFLSGCGGGGGGSDYTDPSVTDSTTSDGIRQGDGEVDITYSLAGPDITDGPDERTNDSSATFEFTEDGSSTYQCALDGASFASCDSPQSYTSLADGSHTFAVRSVSSDETTFSDSTERTWTIDTAPPVVTIDSAPSGTVSASSATVTFHANTDDVAFTCVLDGGASQPCASPDMLTGLGAGAHTLAISGDDDLGNASTAPAAASWTVSPPAATTGPTSSGSASGCAAPALATVTRGALVLLARNGACISPAGASSYVTAGTVSLDGITITPDPGTTLMLGGSAESGRSPAAVRSPSRSAASERSTCQSRSPGPRMRPAS